MVVRRLRTRPPHARPLIRRPGQGHRSPAPRLLGAVAVEIEAKNLTQVAVAAHLDFSREHIRKQVKRRILARILASLSKTR